MNPSKLASTRLSAGGSGIAAVGGCSRLRGGGTKQAPVPSPGTSKTAANPTEPPRGSNDGSYVKVVGPPVIGLPPGPVSL